MCHLFLALPLLALPVFWFWPLAVALPVYAVVVAVALLTYVYAWKAWRLPRVNGLEAMVGRHGKVVAVGARDVMLKLGSELWSARAVGVLPRVGDLAVVIGADSLLLHVRRAAADPRLAGLPAQGNGSSLDVQPRSEEWT